MNRVDLSSNEVEANFVFNLDESKDDVQLINDNEIEDDTYIDYCDSKENHTSRKIRILMSRSIFFVQSSLTIMVCDIIIFIRMCWCKNPLAPEKLESRKSRSPSEPAKEV